MKTQTTYKGYLIETYENHTEQTSYIFKDGNPVGGTHSELDLIDSLQKAKNKIDTYK